MGKRIVKRSKFYFFDTGLLRYLTGIDDTEALDKGPFKGSVFENYVVSEIKKSFRGGIYARGIHLKNRL
ncbi:MAG: DUF4143 domain-containing protein [Spirochaetaceae bacterium]|nr:DUF4143 domain-containing protein [Spirochaetaceae bacterium]